MKEATPSNVQWLYISYCIYNTGVLPNPNTSPSTFSRLRNTTHASEKRSKSLPRGSSPCLLAAACPNQEKGESHPRRKIEGKSPFCWILFFNFKGNVPRHPKTAAIFQAFCKLCLKWLPSLSTRFAGPWIGSLKSLQFGSRFSLQLSFLGIIIPILYSFLGIGGLPVYSQFSTCKRFLFKTYMKARNSCAVQSR